MENLIETLIAFVITSGLIFGTGKSLFWLHDEVKKEALIQISNGLSSSEEMSRALTGESLGI